MMVGAATNQDASKLRRILNALPRGLRRQKLLVALYKLGIVAPVQRLVFNGGAVAWVDLRDAESRANYLSQTFWPEFPRIVAAFLRNGGDLFDVGANFGLVTFGTIPLVQGLGTGFHLFEANPRIIPVLERSAAEWPGEAVRIVQGCISDTPGTSYHLLPDSSWGHGLIADHGVPVSNLLLDDYIARNQIGRISFLKLDIEGWELHALRGGRQAFSSGKVEAGYVEVSPDALRRAGASPAELLNLLEELGFDPYFAAHWDYEDPYGLRWARVPVNGTSLRFAPASTLPDGFTQGDVLVIHRTALLAEAVRAATR